MRDADILAPPPALKAASVFGLAVWCLVAAFPLVWIAAVSLKLPLDAFSPDPFQVLLGPNTRENAIGVSTAGIAVGAAALYLLYRLGARMRRVAAASRSFGASWRRVLAVAAFFVAAALLFIAAAPPVTRALDDILSRIPGLRLLAEPIVGVTGEHYRTVWVEKAFYRQFINSMYVTAGVVTISLTVGTLAAYGFARRRSNIAFWLLIAALILRAMPHSVLVAGYLPVFINSRELLTPLWESAIIGPVLHLLSDRPPSFYGQPLAVIAVLVAINQPFTIWMLRSFFAAIPVELDEAARVDGCTPFAAFRLVILPIMWPGVITTGLFSFLLAYNDYLVAALLLDAQSLTMVPAISLYLASENTTTEQLHAIAAAVSITAPLFLLVLVFQKRLVTGLVQGAVKG